MKVSNAQYAKILHSMTQGKSKDQVDSAVFLFAKFLMEKKAFSKAEKIMENFSKFWNSTNAIVDCEVSSVESLSEENLKKIEDYVLRKYSAEKVEMSNVTDKKIKGGVVIRIGDEIIDASVDGQLKRLKKQLTS